MTGGIRFFHWGPHYHLGVTEIDTQHESLAGLLNQLSDEQQSERPRAALAETIQRFIDAAAEHFDTEERLMVDREYPESEDHTAEHSFLIEQVLEFQRAFLTGETEVTDSLMIYLKDWLRNHMLVSDRRLAVFLTAIGEVPNRG